MQVVEALQQTGAALITIHGRTMQQGYRKTADWDLIEQAAAASTIPIVGNGDVLTYYEVGTPGRIACVVSSWEPATKLQMHAGGAGS